MNAPKFLIGGLCLAVLTAGCQRPTVYTPADIGAAPLNGVQSPVASQGIEQTAQPVYIQPTPEPVYVQESTPAYDTAPEPSYVIESETVVEPAYVVETETVVEPAYVIENDGVVEPAYVIESETVVEPAYVVESETIAEPVYITETGAASAGGYSTEVLDAPVLDSSAAPVVEQNFSTFSEEIPFGRDTSEINYTGSDVMPADATPLMIESEVLSLPNAAPYGSAL